MAILLRTTGHIVTTTRERNGESNNDAEQLRAAIHLDSTLLTHDDDFRRIHLNWSDRPAILRPLIAHAGILLIPAFPIWTADHTAAEIETFLQHQVMLANQLHEWTRDGWRRL